MVTFKQFFETMDYVPPGGTQGINAVLRTLETKYPNIHLSISESQDRINFSEIRVPEDLQNQGIGSDIIKTIQNYAQFIGKPIVLSPEAGRGKKQALERFYKSHGFVYNRGRNRDYRLSSFVGITMIWRPKNVAR